ncbi:MAG TPA: hypothetical protein VMO80_16305 [Terriglobales bacterium]|jgi:hypothetical protein|nr:hypothetical protein [Terriglobales bacterium]
MHRIKSVGILSCAKIFGALYGCMGLLFLPFALIGGIFSMFWPHPNGAIGGAALLALAVLAPLIYGCMGFVVGALTAWLYNLIARWTGGIDVELQGPTQLGAPVGPV